jgi:hypothetical protein
MIFKNIYIYKPCKTHHVGLDAVAHLYNNPSYLGGRNWDVQGFSGQKVVETPP